jgi:hypothetical protein
MVEGRYSDFTGRSFVVFGQSGTTAVDLSALSAGGSSQGFAIEGEARDNLSGTVVAGLGDVNGDGLADVLVTAPRNGEAVGRSYVVFGHSGSGLVQLSAVAAGSGGFAINGESAMDWSGQSAAAAGDVNGDGLADLILSSWGHANGSGRSYVVFGQSGGTALDLSAVAAGHGGFALDGLSNERSGVGVSAAGDVNGDGLADLIVGGLNTHFGMGGAYVVFGSTDGSVMPTAVNQLGTGDADTLSDGGTAQTLAAGAGNDTLTATAASVLYGGAGDDSFHIDGAMITALQSGLGSGGNAERLARIDGGTGLDTLALSGSALTLDLSLLAQPAAGNATGSNRVDSIERVDLTGSGDNTLALKAADVLQLTGFNAFTGNGRHELLVQGNAGDKLDLTDGSGTSGWTQDSDTTLDGTAYHTWHHDTTRATVYVNTAMQVI